MIITVIGNEKEIVVAKESLDSTCVFSGKYCRDDLDCKECENKHNLKIEYKVEDEQ